MQLSNQDLTHPEVGKFPERQVRPHIPDMLGARGRMRLGPFIHACRFWGEYQGDSGVLTGAL